MADADPLTQQQKAQRLTVAGKLIAALQERDNVGLTLHAEADRFVGLGNFDQAAKCCHTSMILAQQAGDTYARAASEFHLGLAYFVLRAGEWDRAADLCKDAALIFHTADPKRAEGVAYFAAAHILQDACARGQDRWEPALDNALRALMLLQEVTDQSRSAHDFFNRLNKLYTDHLATTVPAPSSESAPPPAPPATAAPAASAPTETPSVNPDRTTASASVATPQPAPQEKSKPRPRGRRLSTPPRPQLERWTWYFWATFTGFITILFAFAGSGVIFLFSTFFPIAIGLLVGAGAVLVATLLPFVLLKFIGQLDFWGQRGVAAIVIDTADGRLWTFENEAHHWLLPFRQHLAAWLPTNARPIKRFTPGATTPGQNGVAAHLTVKIRVADAGLVWDRIAGTLTPIVRLGIPFPMRVEDTEGRLDEYAGRRAVEYLDLLALALPGLDENTLAHLLLKQLRQEVGSTGIFYSDLHIKKY